MSNLTQRLFPKKALTKIVLGRESKRVSSILMKCMFQCGSFDTFLKRTRMNLVAAIFVFHFFTERLNEKRSSLRLVVRRKKRYGVFDGK